KKTITAHIATPMKNARPGQTYGRHARLAQASGPTTASASRQRPSIRKPVANSQWTISAVGCIESLAQARRDEPGEEHADEQHPERRLGDEPPEALPVRMQDGQAVRLDHRPEEPGGGGAGPEPPDCPGAPGAGAREPACYDVHEALPHSLRRRRRVRGLDRPRCCYAVTGGGRDSNASPKRLRGVRRAVWARRGAAWVSLGRIAWLVTAAAVRSSSCSQRITRL